MLWRRRQRTHDVVRREPGTDFAAGADRRAAVCADADPDAFVATRAAERRHLKLARGGEADGGFVEGSEVDLLERHDFR